MQSQDVFPGMATARRETVTRTMVVLELTDKQAQVLRDLLACVGGNQDTSDRKHADAVAEALSGAGYGMSPPRYTGSIYCE